MTVAGFGFRAGADLGSLRSALDEALAHARTEVGLPNVSALAAPRDKAALLEALARMLGVPVLSIEPPALEAAATVTISAASLAARRTGSVAEAAALAGAGPDARLLTTRHVSPDRMATCALARGNHP
ncbi:cobalamin biosynthesis protein [Novosphingobium sp. BL-52-GroH]|uniref:cobalamin biosynthesis protein n=1 Tax=Novosphingobium sp. BL-52-GroH TaxID=3349877 RepID=UPI00384FB902